MNAKNRQAGISANTAAAIMSPQETANFDTKLSSPTGKVITSFLLINISENNSSLHAAVNTKPSVAAIPGNVSGIITLRSAIKRLHQERRERHVESGVNQNQPEQAVG